MNDDEINWWEWARLAAGRISELWQENLELRAMIRERELEVELLRGHVSEALRRAGSNYGRADR